MTAPNRAYTLHGSPLRCPDEQWLADALLGCLIPQAEIDALIGQAAALRRTVAQIEAVSTRLAAQRRAALAEADALHADLRRLGGKR